MLAHRGGDFRLLLLFRVDRVLSQTRRILLQLQLLAARLSPQNVVVIARFLADQEDSFRLFLALAALFLSHIPFPRSR